MTQNPARQSFAGFFVGGKGSPYESRQRASDYVPDICGNCPGGIPATRVILGEMTNSMDFSSKPWRSHTLQGGNPLPTMLSLDELRLLNWLSCKYYRGAGAIIDAGCFLGGSTAALASGLSRGTIHSYDMFQTDDSWSDVTFSSWGLKPNESFEELFRRNVADYLPRIQVHAGDLLKQTWHGEPVEILFLDICKTPALLDHATQLWFPRLIPGRSILVQQDYGWRRWYWGNVMMEVYKDHFTILDDVDVSRVYLCTKAISDEDASSKLYSNLSSSAKLQYMEDAVATVANPLSRAHLLFSYAQLADSIGAPDRAKEAVKRILSLSDQLTGALGDPIGTTLAEFSHHFTGANALQKPLQHRPISQPTGRRSLSWFKRLNREAKRLIGRKMAG
jgi:hypothetical protein